MLTSGSRLGPYEIVSPIGAGGMGEVWKARDTRLERSVAIKVLPADFAGDAQLRLRFDREAKTISQFEHPHICRLYDVGETAVSSPGEPSVSYLVLELLEGDSLADRLSRGPLPMSDVLRYGAQIADALERAHRAGVIHRDLKPGNVMITRSGAKLLDFGLATTAAPPLELDGATVQKPLTREGTIVGTFHYMAPEQLDGAEADARSDIFALGAVLYEMATGRRAFEGKTRSSVIAAIVEREPTPISQLQPLTPPLFERVVATCLRKDPEERWQSAGDLRREIEWIREGVAASHVAAAAPKPRRAAWTAAVVLIAAAAAAAGFFLSRATAPEPIRVVSAIAPPPGSHFVVTGDVAGPVTLSPDGRRAAFVARTADRSQLWVQSLESGSNTPLPGTERAMFPFWSQDSRSLGFFADGRLLVIDVDGSAPRALTTAPDGRGGAWGADGQILFTPRTQAGVFRISSSGGPATELTRPVQPHSTHRWPALLPDGKHFVYLAASHGNPAGAETAIMIASLDGRVNRKLVASEGNGVPLGDHLVYRRGDQLVAQRLDDGELRGPIEPIWGRTLYDPGTWRSIVSVSSTGLLATYPATELNGLRLVNIDADGQWTEIGEPALYRDVALSPDGDKIAMTVGDPNSILYVQDLRRKVRTRFSFLNAVGYPAWTPDGKFIVFNSVRPDGGFDLLIKPVDGSAKERVLTSSAFPMQPTSVDGTRGVVVYNLLNSGADDIMAVPLTGGAPFTVLGGAGQQTNGAVSPDGRWLAYVEVGPSGRAAFVTTYPTAGPKWQMSEETVYWLWWVGSGTELRYLTGNGEVKTVTVTTEGNAVQFSAPHSPLRVNVNTNRRALSTSTDGRRMIAASVDVEDPGPAILVSNVSTKLP